MLEVSTQFRDVIQPTRREAEPEGFRAQVQQAHNAQTHKSDASPSGPHCEQQIVHPPWGSDAKTAGPPGRVVCSAGRERGPA
eukprot:1564893-Rhodomonas_salina.4